MTAPTKIITITCLLGLTGCASMPDATVTYYLPKATLKTTVIQTLSCNTDGDAFSALQVFPEISYARDISKPRTIRTENVNGALSNSEIGLTLTEDGRLSGIGITQVGQGSEVVKSALVLASTVAVLGSGGAKNCDYVKANGKDGALTLKFHHTEEFPTANSLMKPSDDTRLAYDAVQGIVGDLNIKVTTPTESEIRRVVPATRGRATVPLGVVQPAYVDVSIVRANATLGSGPIWNQTFAVPQLGETYELPVPKAAVFGKQVMTLKLADSGAILELKYGKDSGAASALAAANEAASHFKGDTTAEAAKELKDEADLIAQQQRLVRCRANPTACS